MNNDLSIDNCVSKYEKEGNGKSKTFSEFNSMYSVDQNVSEHSFGLFKLPSWPSCQLKFHQFTGKLAIYIYGMDYLNTKELKILLRFYLFEYEFIDYKQSKIKYEFNATFSNSKLLFDIFSSTFSAQAKRLHIRLTELLLLCLALYCTTQAVKQMFLKKNVSDLALSRIISRLHCCLCIVYTLPLVVLHFRYLYLSYSFRFLCWITHN